ncbi:MAG: flagellar biosynthesis anti-sigma factor FlgM [Treponema sp.]|jgi:negative regulator of flagellin synthesis FlgM|nr:flagellar biosynthesis anti-sigma factor FlgM [Treponema sp.]
MTIDRIGHIDPIQPGKKPGRNDQVRGSDKTDSINLSQEAKIKAEMYQVVELIKSAPEVDEARIAELRQKINDPAYLNDTVINATAEKLLTAFGI